MTAQRLGSGLYLVVDPSMPEKILLDKLGRVLHEKIVAIQIWDHFPEEQHAAELIEAISERVKPAHIPVFINNRWEYLMDSSLSGVHFDEIPSDFEYIKTSIDKPFLTGLTCTNDLSQIRWAAEKNIDYLSFCSMFPSATANSCELVDFETVRLGRAIFKNPIFLAGGITPEHIEELKGLPYDGIAVVSGVMSAADPAAAIQTYYEKLSSKL